MKFATTLFGLLGSAAMASAATVTFWTLDDKVRTVTFTSNENRWPIAPVTVSNKEKTVVTFPDNYVGNWYSTIEGEAKAAHPLLGEVQFGGWGGKTYFDVSAVDDPTMQDQKNVQKLWPAGQSGPWSGCDQSSWAGCQTLYILWDDVQTKVTEQTDLIQTLGVGATPVQLAAFV
ncbi:unnamed protein product [Clonostachys chloroleuca]|uniref:DNase1 protein n=1 Tax=Clonostachys chloroleuca TaxID=1926264 RepID=A0AA35MFX8_9HYPO|nr:unnamed protein product [Clonostachys chloroleuca]